jgi:hypothetical protein
MSVYERNDPNLIPPDLRRIVGIVLAILGIVLFFHIAVSVPAFAQQPQSQWMPWINLSNSPLEDSEPVIASDSEGNVHIAWSQTDESFKQVIYYARWTRGRWSRPIDVLFSPDKRLAQVTSIVVDRQGIIHLIFVNQNGGLFYSSAHVSQAFSAKGWSEPKILVDRVTTSSTGAMLHIDKQDHLRLVYGSGNSAQIYYVHSSSNGRTWSAPMALADVEGIEVKEVVESVYIAQDQVGRLHVGWTARKMPEGWPGTRAFYARSLDGGNIWSAPLLIDDWKRPGYAENSGPFFLSVGTRGADEVHLAWAGAPQGERWCQWSSDGGKTWAPKQRCLGERRGRTGFLDMIEDGAGVLHLFSTFADNAPNAPREFLWSGSGWVDMGKMTTQGMGGCENPRAALALGSELHVVCVDRRSALLNDIYATRKSLAITPMPAQPLPTFAPTLEIPTPTVSSRIASPTRPPNQDKVASTEPPTNFNTWSNPMMGIGAGAVPVVLFLFVFLLIRFRYLR